MDFEFEKKLIALRRKAGRYHLNAFLFVFEALDYTIRHLGKHVAKGEERHISGKELLEGMKQLGVVQFGPMAKMVFNSWGIESTKDFGEIVFLLVDAGLLKKRDSDTKADFEKGFDFAETFERNYQIDLSLDLS